MTKKELECKLKEILNNLKNCEKKEFLNDLKSMKKETDKLDPIFKNIIEDIGITFTFNLDRKILRVIYDIADNIESEKLDINTRNKIETLITNFLINNKKKDSEETTDNTNNNGNTLWEETKKVRKAI